MRRAGAVGLACALLLAACGPAPPQRALACRAAPRPPVDRAPDGRTATTRLSVLTYNVEGLGWPARNGRAAKLREIGTRLAALHEAGTAPDIVLFQEVFSAAAKRAVAGSGYPAITAGPRRTTRAPAGTAAVGLPGKAKASRGELGLHLVGSGLVTASRYPIVHSDRRAFGRGACAGFDCLSNKGVALARIVVPGVPTAIDVYNTHLNAKTASRAPQERRIAAHARQSRAAAEFVARTRDPEGAVIFAGDFNMKHSDRRWRHFSRLVPLGLVHKVCATPAGRCDVRLSWDGDAPWRDTQDLQFFGSGRAVAIRPIRVEAMFDGGPGGPALSDHDGLLVTYELRWPVAPPSRSRHPLPTLSAAAAEESSAPCSSP